MDTGSIEADSGAQNGVAVIYLKGEHDLHTAPDVQERLAAALRDCNALITDLTGATFVDSSIVGVLLDARQTAANNSKRFAVCLGPESSESVKRIFDITGLTESLPVVPDHDRAIAAADGTAPPE